MPYSDNMYSSLHASDGEPMDDDPLRAHQPAGAGGSEGALDEQEALAPSDGYFGRSGASASSPPPLQRDDPWRPSHLTTTHTTTTSATSYAGAASSRVPHVPDVWVSDPSLGQDSTAESKAREAREEREQNRRLDGPQPSTALPETTLPAAAAPAAAASTGRGGFSTYPKGHARTSSAAISGHAPYRPYHHTHTPSSTSYPSRARRSETLYSERSSLFSTPNEAPPAYTPSPTSPTTTGSTSPVPPRGYSTFTTPAAIMGRQEETQALLAHQPESMGGPSGPPGSGGVPAWGERVRRRLAHANMRNCRMVLLVLLLLGVTVGFLVSSILGVRNEKHKGHAAPPGTPDTPGGGSPSKPAYGKVPIEYPPIDNGDFEWNARHRCASAKIKAPEISWDVQFSRGRNLTFIQDIGNEAPSTTRDILVSGDVIFRRTGDGTPGPSLVLESVVNDEAIGMASHWDSDEQELHLTVPRSVPWSETGRSPCIHIRATVWVPAGGTLDNINVDNVHLGIQLLDNLSIDLGGSARFRSVVGDIVAATDGRPKADHRARDGAPATFSLSARHVEVKTTSADISGSWPLYDFLGIETVSGAVKAGVAPKAASEEKRAPALLYVRSLSGDVEVWEPVHEAQQTFFQQQAQQGVRSTARPAAEAIVPPRDYRADLSSASGGLRGALAIGSHTRVHTTSGHVAFDLLPVFDKALAGAAPAPKTWMELETAAVSGTTSVRVLEPLWVDVETSSYYPVGAPEAPRAPLAPPAEDYVDAGAGDPYNIIPPALEAADEDGQVEASTAAAAAAATTTEQKQQQQQRARSAALALRCLEATHHSTSADLTLRYPGSWEGNVDATTTSGNVSLRGKGLVVRQAGKWPIIGMKLSGHKGPGTGGGHVTVKTVSGGTDFAVGEV